MATLKDGTTVDGSLVHTHKTLPIMIVNGNLTHGGAVVFDTKNRPSFKSLTDNVIDVRTDSVIINTSKGNTSATIYDSGVFELKKAHVPYFTVEETGNIIGKIEWSRVQSKPIVGTTGTSTTNIMHQKVVTDELAKKLNIGDFGVGARSSPRITKPDGDMNIHVPAGFYTVEANVPNTPDGAGSGDSLIEWGWDSNNYTQIFMTGDGHLHTRKRSFGRFRDWKRLATKEELDKVNDGIKNRLIKDGGKLITTASAETLLDKVELGDYNQYMFTNNNYLGMSTTTNFYIQTMEANDQSIVQVGYPVMTQRAMERKVHNRLIFRNRSPWRDTTNTIKRHDWSDWSTTLVHQDLTKTINTNVANASDENIPTEKAVRTELNKKIDGGSVQQTEGSSTVNVMSQKATTDALNKRPLSGKIKSLALASNGVYLNNSSQPIKLEAGKFGLALGEKLLNIDNASVALGDSFVNFEVMENYSGAGRQIFTIFNGYTKPVSGMSVSRDGGDTWSKIAVNLSTYNTTVDGSGFVRSSGSKHTLTTDKVVQTTGTSTTNVPSQKVFTDQINGVNSSTDTKLKTKANIDGMGVLQIDSSNGTGLIAKFMNSANGPVELKMLSSGTIRLSSNKTPNGVPDSHWEFPYKTSTEIVASMSDVDKKITDHGSLGTKNLDTVTQYGMHHQTMNENATTARNYPASLAGTLWVLPSAGVTQIYITYNQGQRIYTRNNYGDKWDNWTEVLNTSDIINSLGTATNKTVSQKVVNDVSIRTTTAQSRADNAWTLGNNALAKAQNLKDLANVTTARTNLGLGNSAIRNMTSDEGTSDTLVASQKLVGNVKVGLTKDIDDVRIQIVSSMAMGHNILSKSETHNTIFEKNKTGDVYIKSGNAVYNGSEWLTINVPIPIEIRDWEAGNDYAVYILPNKTAVAVKDPFNSPSSTPHVGAVLVGGFHIGLVPKGTTTSSGGFATSGNGMIWTNDDVDRISGVNEFSFWDLRFRGGGIVNNGGARDGQLSNHGFVYDPTAGLYTAIYHVSTDVDVNGLSMAGSNMASGTVLPVIPRYYGGDGSKKYANMNWWTSNEIVSSQGARLMYEKEFNSRAFGATENKVAGGASSTYPKTERINGLTSKIGAEQVVGTHWYWGLDSNYRYDGSNFSDHDVTGGRGQIYSQGTYGIIRVLLGGQRAHALARVGSRRASWSHYPWYSDWSIGAVAVRDLLIL